jgi:hypothetical protein
LAESLWDLLVPARRRRDAQLAAVAGQDLLAWFDEHRVVSLTLVGSVSVEKAV